MPDDVFFSAGMNSGEMTSGLNRRDADLLSVVRWLELSINTLDINARLCLRDALVSLSNKASNPAMPPTPQQEAMNRAAEYLVLRMLCEVKKKLHALVGVSTACIEVEQSRVKVKGFLVTSECTFIYSDGFRYREGYIPFRVAGGRGKY